MSRFLRRRRPDEEQHASNLELFYDLVFVLAVTQVSHLLLDDLTWRGAGRATLVLLVVWWAWNYTTWVTNMLDPDAVAGAAARARDHVREPRDGGRDPRRVRQPGAALRRRVRRDPGRAGTRSSPSSSAARDSPERRAGAPHPDLVRRLRRVLARRRARVEARRGSRCGSSRSGSTTSAPLVLYRVPGRPQARPVGLGRRDVALRGALPALRDHRARRVDRVTGATTSELPLDAARMAAFGLAFLSTAALWWLYFSYVAAIAAAPPRARGRPARRSRATATPTCTSCSWPGIIVSAVGDEIVIAHPTDMLPTAELVAVVAGPAIYLLGHVLFRLRMAGSVSGKRLAGAIACVRRRAPRHRRSGARRGGAARRRARRGDRRRARRRPAPAGPGRAVADAEARGREPREPSARRAESAAARASPRVLPGSRGTALRARGHAGRRSWAAEADRRRSAGCRRR